MDTSNLPLVVFNSRALDQLTNPNLRICFPSLTIQMLSFFVRVQNHLAILVCVDCVRLYPCVYTNTTLQRDYSTPRQLYTKTPPRKDTSTQRDLSSNTLLPQTRPNHRFFVELVPP